MKENSIGDRIEEKYTRYINCETDILELTIEEAIFILEKDVSVHYVEDLLQEAYKVILSDYKRVLKENEQLRTEVNSLKKENEELKNDYENLNNSVVVKNYYIKNSIPIQKVKDRIEKYKKLSDKFYVKFLESDRYNTDIREKGIKCDAIILALEELIEERKVK